MKQPSGAKLGDLIVNGMAILLAGSCGVFAGYMIIRLNHMENPPANMGLNFPPAKKRVITDEAVEADPLPTGSIQAEARVTPARPLQAYSRRSPVTGHRLLVVVNGLAFVEVSRVTGKEIVAMQRGEDLPGAGPVAWIERIDGRWQLQAGDIQLVSDRP